MHSSPQRRAKLRGAARGSGQSPFRTISAATPWPASCMPNTTTRTTRQLEAQPVRVKVAGRLMAKRVMGKASFAQLQDMSGRIQLFLQRDTLPEGVYQDFKGWDIGDIVGAEGVLFKTKTGELSVRVESIRIC